jgi:hypothetical protein
MRALHPLAIVATSMVALIVACVSPRPGDTTGGNWPAPLDDASFRAMVRSFSEPAGAFTPVGGYRSDNLVSNERSLQRVIQDFVAQ